MELWRFACEGKRDSVGDGSLDSMEICEPSWEVWLLLRLGGRLIVERLTSPRPTAEPLSVLPEGVGAGVLIAELVTLSAAF